MTIAVDLGRKATKTNKTKWSTWCIAVSHSDTLELGTGIANEICIILYRDTESLYGDMYHDTYHENIDSLRVRR